VADLGLLDQIASLITATPMKSIAPPCFANKDAPFGRGHICTGWGFAYPLSGNGANNYTGTLNSQTLIFFWKQSLAATITISKVPTVIE